jgi:hypothetical protein
MIYKAVINAGRGIRRERIRPTRRDSHGGRSDECLPRAYIACQHYAINSITYNSLTRQEVRGADASLWKGFWNGIKSPALWARPQKNTMRWRAFRLRTYTHLYAPIRTYTHLYALYALCAGHLGAFLNPGPWGFFALTEINTSQKSR